MRKITNVSNEVERTLSRFNEGKIFKYSDIPLYKEKPGAVVTAVCRMVQKDKIKRLSDGQYYIPRQTLFGTARPKDADIIKSYLFSGKKQVGYVTGLALYNKWGLTTQVPNVVEIATLEKRKTPKLNGLQIKLIKPRYTKVTKNNASYLQFLDAIQNINKIPDADPSQIWRGLRKRLELFDENDFKKLEKIATASYPPATRALLGALLETWCNYISSNLQNSINPLSQYKVGVIGNKLSNARRWSLKASNLPKQKFKGI